MDKKHIEKESFPNNLKIEEIDPRTKGSTIDAFQPFQNIKDQEERKDPNEAFSFEAPSPSSPGSDHVWFDWGIEGRWRKMLTLCQGSAVTLTV